jgi:hypothetical protein
MFCLADIKNKDNFGKTVGPAPAKDLWIPNPNKFNSIKTQILRQQIGWTKIDEGEIRGKSHSNHY